jgi:hypothetical protein
MKKTPKNKALTYSVYGAVFALTIALFAGTTPAFADTPLYATCTATPYNALVGDNVNWQVQGVTGGNNTYLYAWGGTDNLLGSNSSAYKSYTYPGTKIANVTVTSGGQAFTATCSINVAASSGYNYNNGYYNNYPYGYHGSTYNQPTQFLDNGYYYQGVFYPYNNGYNYNLYNNYTGYNPNAACGGYYVGGVYYNSCNNNYNSYNSGTYYTNPPLNGTTYATTYSGNAGTPVAGVFLSQVPSTGISAKNIKMILFTVGLLAWSLFAAYIINFKRKSKLAMAAPNNMSARIEAFKQRNLEKKNTY